MISDGVRFSHEGRQVIYFWVVRSLNPKGSKGGPAMGKARRLTKMEKRLTKIEKEKGRLQKKLGKLEKEESKLQKKAEKLSQKLEG